MLAARAPRLALTARGWARAASGASRPSKGGEQVAHGFSSPGNIATSVEMREAVSPDENRLNEEATQMHMFSEKARFADLQRPVGAAAAPGDTGSDRALSEQSAQTAEGQTHGVLHQSPETLPHAREPGPGEYTDTRAEARAEGMDQLSAEEKAVRGLDVLPGSKGGAAPGQARRALLEWIAWVGRGFHTATYAAQPQEGRERGGGGGEGQGPGAGQGIQPDIQYTPPPPEERRLMDEPRPNPPDERAGVTEDEPAEGEDVAGRRLEDPSVGGYAS